jgi:hypothetical protein
MSSESLLVYKTGGRYRTTPYKSDGGHCFCVAEDTMNGVLLTEFEEGGAIVNQTYKMSKDPESSLKEYLGAKDISIENTDTYNKVIYKSACQDCSGILVRELDLKEPRAISKVPVVPIFACTKCGKRFYSMTDRYLRKLVSENESLFEGEELEEKKKDIDAFINTLNEYIVRVFASKKIGRLR